MTEIKAPSRVALDRAERLNEELGHELGGFLSTDSGFLPHTPLHGFTQHWRHFDFEVSDGVATVTLSRPDKLNALTFDTYADLRDLLAELPHRGDARVLVLTGTGGGRWKTTAR
jgi:hypothetical protein